MTRPAARPCHRTTAPAGWQAVLPPLLFALSGSPLACLPGDPTDPDSGAAGDASLVDAGPWICPNLPAEVQTGQLGSAEDLPATPQRRLVLMGGSSEADTAAASFVASAGGGDVLVLRASGSVDSYTSYFFSELHSNPAPNSVTTLLTDPTSSGGDPAVTCRVDAAEAIWLAGGDQWDYLGGWPDTLHQALERASLRGVGLGGTSAGAMVLGELAFDAERGGLTSSEALSSPTDLQVSLSAPSFAAPELENCVVDTHFSQRDREGRLLAFLAHALERLDATEVCGIGLDERSALIIEAGNFSAAAPTGRGVWIYLVAGPHTLSNGAALSLGGVRRFRLAGGDSGSWPLDPGSWPAETLEVVDGVVQ